MSLTPENYVNDIIYLRRYLTSELQKRGYTVEDKEMFETLFPFIISTIDTLSTGADGLKEQISNALKEKGYTVDTTSSDTLINTICEIIDNINAQHQTETNENLSIFSDLIQLDEGVEENYENYFIKLSDTINDIGISLLEMYPYDITDYHLNALLPYIMGNQTGWLKIRTNGFVRWDYLFYNYPDDPTFLMKNIEQAETCIGMINGCTFDGNLTLNLPNAIDCTAMGGNFTSLNLTFHKKSPINMRNMLMNAQLKSFIMKKAIPSNCDNMFLNATNIGSISFTDVDLSEVTSFSHMFDNCYSLTSLSVEGNFENNANVNNTTCMFQNAANLKSIPTMDLTNVTNADLMFYGATSLATIAFVVGTINVALSFSSCEQLTYDSLISILNGLKDRSSEITPLTLSLGTTNLGKLSDTDKAIATGKGWTLA